MMIMRLATLATLAASLAVIACADSIDPVLSPLADLARFDSDTTVNGPPPTTPSPNPTPGSFRGTVRGYEPGPDTLASAVRLANVTVTAFRRVPTASDTLGLGPEQASVITNAEGEFQLPTMPGGEYIVTFVPHPSSKYRGVWTVATAHESSGEFPWWIMLPVK